MNRFKIKLMNAGRELEGLSEFISVHNEMDDSPENDRLCRAQDQIDEMAEKLRNMESRADKMLVVEY